MGRRGYRAAIWSMFGIDVVGEFGERWNLASHYPVGVTGNQTSAAVEALTCDIENGSVPIRQQYRDTCENRS